MQGGKASPFATTMRPEYDQEAQEEARRILKTAPVNPNQAQQEQMEQARKTLEKQNSLIKDQLPITDFQSDRKGFLDFYGDKLQQSASQENPEDNRDYYNTLDQYGKRYILPDEYKAEFGAMQALNQAIEAYNDVESRFADKDPKLREDVMSKAWARVEKAREGLTNSRELSYEATDKKLRDLQEKREEIENDEGSALNAVLNLIPFGSLLSGESKEEKLAAVDQEIKRLELSKRVIDLSPTGALSAVGVEVGKDEDPAEKLERYYRTLEKAYYDHRGDYEGDLEGAVKGAVGSFFGTDDSRAFADLKMELQALAPLVMLRRVPMGDDGAGEVFYKSFLNSFNPQLQAELEAESTQSSMNRIEGALEMAGAKVSDPDVGQAMDKIASPYEHYSAKDWAQMMGPTTAMMAQITMSSPLYGGIMRATKLGKFLEAGKKTGTILGTEKGMTALGNTSVGRGVVKAVYGGLDEGIKFQTAGSVFGSDEELNFLSGFVGGLAAYPLSTLAEKGAEKTFRKHLGRMFGDKTEDAYRKIYDLGEAMKSGTKIAARGPAETFEEFGNEIGNIYRESSNWSEISKKFEERFGDMSENIHFAVSTAVMGWGFGAATNVGSINLAKSKKHYENLTEVEKQQFRSFMEEMNGEMEEVAEGIADTVNADEEARQNQEPAQEVEPEATESTEDTSGEQDGTEEVSEDAGQDDAEADSGRVDTEEGVAEGTTSGEGRGFAERLGENNNSQVEDIGNVAEGQKKVKILDTEITVSEDADKITLEKIRTDEAGRGKGSATEAMDALIDEADKAGKPIELTLKPEEGTDKQRLREFYKGFGFEGEGDLMTRQPVQDENQDNIQQQETVDEPGVQSQEKNTAEPVKDQAGNEVGSKAYMSGEHYVGRSQTKVLADEERVSGRYKLVEASEVLPSHNENTFAKNEGFPVNENGKTVNDRDYENDSQARDAVIDRSNKFDRRAVQNPPVVTKQGIVVSGNDRTMARKRSSVMGSDEDYVAGLKEDAQMFGIDPSAVDQLESPMLVFEVDEDMEMTTYTWSKFNVDDSKAKSPIAKAVEVGKTISDRTRRQLGDIYEGAEKPSDVTSKPGNVKKVRETLLNNKVITQNQVPEYFNDKNQMTKEGKAFMETLLLGSALSEETIRSLDIEGMGSVRNRMLQSIVELAKNSARGEDSLIVEIEEGVELIRKAKAAGQDVENFISQMDAFEDTRYSAGGLLTALMLNDGGFKSWLKNYNSEVGTESLFEGELTKDKLLETGLQSKLDNYEQAVKNLRGDEQGPESEGRQGDGQGDQFQQETSAREETRSVVQKIAEQITQTFNKLFGTDVKIGSPESVDGAVGKATAEGDIVLNEEKLNSNTPVHEAGHLWNRWAKENRPELYEEGLNKVRKSNYYYAVKENPFYQEQTKDMTPEQAEEFYLEEALAVAIGNSGESFVTEARKKGFKEWFQNLMDAIADFLGIERMSIEQVREMSLDEFSKRVAASILAGEEIEGFVNGEFSDQYMAEKRRKFDKTMEENTTFEFVRERARKNPARYKQQSNEETIEKAIAWIEQKKSPDFAYQALLKPETWTTLGQDLAMINTATFILADTYATQFEANLESNEELAKQYLERWESLKEIMDKTSTNLGRAVNAYNIWKTMTPIGMAYMIDQKIKDINSGNLSKQDIEGLQELMDELAEVKGELDQAKKRIVEEVMKTKQVKDALEAIIKQRQSNVDADKSGEADTKRGDQKGSSTKATRGKKRNRAYKPADKVKEAKADFKKALDKFKNSKGSASVSAAFLNNEQIEALGEMVIALTKQGYYRTQEIVDEILDQIDAESLGIDEKEVEAVVQGTITSNSEVRQEIDDNYDRITNTTAKKLGKPIEEIVKKHYNERDPLKRSLAEKISEELGLNADEAKLIADSIERLVQKSAQAYIDKYYKKKEKKPTKAREAALDVFVNSINNGVLDNDAYRAEFLKRFKMIPELTAEQIAKIKALTENMQNQEGEFYLEAVRDLVKYTEQLIPKNWFDTFMDRWMGILYGSMLSGVGTHIVNIYSVASNILPDAMGDMVNVSEHVNRIKKNGIKSPKDLSVWNFMPDFVYRWAGAISGLLTGKAYRSFKRVWKGGSFDDKWVDDISKNNRPFNVAELERGDHTFKGGKLNPYNYIKYVNRALSGEDSFMRSSYSDAYLAEQYREMLSKNLGREATVAEVQALVNYDSLTEDQINRAKKQAEKEAEQYRQTTGKELDKSIVKQRVDEILRDLVNAELKLTADAAEELMDNVHDAAKYSVFTGERHGAISRIGRVLNMALGSHRLVRFALMRDVPFVTIVANVVEHILDGLPIYGLARAYGISPTGIYGRISGNPSARIENEIASRRQVARAWLGTIGFALGVAMFKLDDDDDPEEVPVLITGSATHKGDAYAKNYTYEPYTIYIRMYDKEIALNYLNWPGMNAMLNAIGEMNDRVLMDKNLPKEERTGNIESFVRAVTLDQVEMVMNMSFLQGLTRLVEDAQIIASEYLGKDTSPKESKQDETDIPKYVEKRLIEKYLPLMTDLGLHNTNFVKQIGKTWMQEAYTRKTIDEAVAYALSSVSFRGNFRVDAMGEKVFTVPTDTFLPIRHYAEDKSNDERWALLRKAGYIPHKPQNRVQTIKDKDGVTMKRKMTANEEAYYNTRAGEIFSDYLTVYIRTNPEREQDRKLDVQHLDSNKKQTSLLREEIIRLHEDARKRARKETKDLIKNGTFDKYYDQMYDRLKNQ